MAAALAVVARDGWRDTGLRAIAAEAGCSLSALLPFLSSKHALFDLIARQADAAMLADDLVPDAQESTRDQLFELLMRRFDALEPHRAGIAILLRQSAQDPAALLCGGFAAGRSMGLALEAAGLQSSGVKGLLRRKGLGAVALYALRAWLGDETPDRSITMAALDKALRRAEALVCMVVGRPEAPPPPMAANT